MNATAITMTRIPYRGSANLMPDLLEGRVQAAFVPPGIGTQHSRSGKLKLLACSTEKRIGALAETPSLNGRIWLGRYIPHETVSVSFLVALEEGGDLGKAKIERADEKGPQGIARELGERARKLHQGKDDAFNKSKGAIRLLPTWILRPMLRLVGWLGGCGGFSIPALGVEPYPFGAAIITSVGMLGIDEGLVPPTPFAHVPIYVCVGAQRRMPAEWKGELALRPQVTLTATIDHRFVDGYQLATLTKRMRELFANPWTFSGLERAPEAAPAS